MRTLSVFYLFKIELSLLIEGFFIIKGLHREKDILVVVVVIQEELKTQEVDREVHLIVNEVQGL